MKRKGLQILTVALVAALLCSIASATLGRQELTRGLALSDRVDLYNGVRTVTDDKGTARPVQEKVLRLCALLPKKAFRIFPPEIFSVKTSRKGLPSD